MEKQTVEVIRKYSKEALDNILRLEKECFPVDWQYEDAEEYYKGVLLDSNNINLFLEDDNNIVGYLLACPHNACIDDLIDYDPKILEDGSRYYFETIQISPQYQGKGGATKLINAMISDAKRRGISKFSVHARTLNNFNEKIKKMFNGGITSVRRIDSWKFGGGEPYEYIEWEINK